VSAEFRLLTYGREHPPCAGVLIRDHIFPAATLLDGGDGIDASSMLTLLRSWEVAHPRLHEIAQRTPPVDGLSPRGDAGGGRLRLVSLDERFETRKRKARDGHKVHMIDDAIVWRVRRIALVVVANKLHRTAQQSTWPLTSSRQIWSAAKTACR
jgi:hypothetical protein